ncbi:MAG: hypothetical protein JRH20_27740 [Deltaproteobacteria bacterium]|nr:hypothetical protein [Deltaproteobacteria bacterium]
MFLSPAKPALCVFLQACARGGIDLAAACQVGAYNAAVAAEVRLPDFGEPRSRVVILANSRALWAPFIVARRAAGVSGDLNPLDGYVERVIGDAATQLSVRYELRFAHEHPPRRVAIQELARLTGLAALSPAHLSVHPDFGPWIGLRAALVMDSLGPEMSPREAPCAGCAAPCLAALKRALAAGADSEKDWQEWVVIRDVCPMGREHRYGDDQLRYHYTKDPTWLR